MSKIKLFLENFFVYGIGGIINKIIPLVMIPIVTRLLPDTSYFGISDMAVTVVSLCSLVAVMGLNDAMYRLFVEKEDLDYKKEICSTTLSITIIISIIVFLLMLLFHDFIAEKCFGDNKYNYLVFITAVSTLTGATNSIVSAPTRMQNNRKTYIFMNVVTSVLSYSAAIVLILNGYYIIALPVGNMFASISCEVIFFMINKKWFKVKYIKKRYLNELIKIGVPLLPGFLTYWLFNSCDRLMITNMLGTAATGVYSVGAKLGNVSQLIYTAFAGGWQYFAFSTMNEKNQVDTNSKIFEYLGIISYICSIFVFVLCEGIYKILFTGDYVKGYIVSPYLFLAPLLQMLFQVASNQLLIIKKTWPNIVVLMSGAIVNIILNIILIPKLGIEGAAIASLIGYIVSDVLVVLLLIKMGLMRLDYKFILISLLMILYILLWRMFLMKLFVLNFLIGLIVCFTILYVYKKSVVQIINKIKRLN